MMWSLISGNILGGEAATNALFTWRAHVPDDPTDRLVDIALNDTRNDLRWHAINALGAEHATLAESLLESSPDISWSLHSQVLENLFEGDRVSSSWKTLMDVDDLFVAAACAQLASRS
jgi:hypothetical protein